MACSYKIMMRYHFSSTWMTTSKGRYFQELPDVDKAETPHAICESVKWYSGCGKR